VHQGGAQPVTDPGPRRTRVLVTGASSGIGRATAHALSAQGARVGLLSRSADVLEQVRQECLARGAADAVVVPADVRDSAGVDKAVDELVERWGAVDGVAHAAAVLAYGRFEDVPAEVFDATTSTNINGTANVARSALRVFGDGMGGSLVLVGSVLGLMTAPLMSPYATSKWAVHGLARTLQIEARRTPGIEVSLVSPGSVDTPIYRLAGSYTGRSGQPPPPVDPPEKVASAIIDLLETPRRARSVGAANALMVMGFRFVPPVFDRLVTPLMSWLGQGRGVDVGPGNVLEPVPEREAVRGHWPHRFRR
jgi:NAD(P)-dependent dehydrogenase (short-subunit alcohol dehydrogenase family)